MTTQYTPILKLALPVTGELSGTWGDVVNDNITSMVEQAIAGLATISTWTGNSHTLTTANGTTSESRCAMLVAQDGAGLTAAGEIVCPASSKLYVLKNATSYTITLKTAAGTGVAVVSGNTAFLFCDGTNVNACVTTIVDGRVTGNLTVDGNATVNGNTTLGNATSDTITATARFASGLTPSADNTYDLGSTGNSWKDLYIDGTAYLALVDINGGTIDGVSIGASTAATIINVDNLRLDGNTISSTDTNGNVVIAPNGTGDVQLDADTVRVGDSGAAATLTSNGAGALTVTTGGAADLTLSTNSGTTSGTIVIANGAGGNITLTPEGTGDVILSADRVQIGDANTDTTLTTNGTGSLNLTTNNGTNSGTIQIAQGANGNITLTPNGTGSVSVPKFVWSNGTATRVPYLTTGGQFTDSANLTFNGTDLTVSGAVNAGSVNATTLDLTNLEVTNIKAKDGTASITLADSTGVASFTANPVLSGGTANGVAYLNGSKVLTTGSALTFDGTGALSLANTGNVIATIQSTSTGGTRSATLRLNVASTGGDDPAGTIAFTYGAGFTQAAAIEVTHTSPLMKFVLGSTERVRINSTGNFETRPAANGHAVFNEDGVDADFRVESDTSTHMLFVDAGNNTVGINQSSPSYTLDVNGSFRSAVTGGSVYTQSAGGIPRFYLGGGNGFGFNRQSAGEDIFFGEPGDTGTWRVRGAGTISLGVGSSGTTITATGNGGRVGINKTTLTGGTGDTTVEGVFQIASTDNATSILISASGSGYAGLKFKNGATNIGGGADWWDITVRPSYSSGVASGPDQPMIRFDTPYAGQVAVVVNEGSNDVDFRVESDTNTHAFFLDAGNSRVAINTSDTANAVFTVAGPGTSTATTAFFANVDGTYNPYLFIQNLGSAGMKVLVSSSYGGSASRLNLEVANANCLNMTPGEVAINDGSADMDFRVESDANTHMLFVDAGNNRVGVGTASPGMGSLHVVGQVAETGTNTYYAAKFSAGSYADSGSYTTMIGLGVEGGAWSKGAIGFTRYSSYDVGYIGFYVNGDTTGSSSATLNNERVRITPSDFVVNDIGADYDFRVESDGNTHMLFVDGGLNRVSIGRDNPNATLDVAQPATGDAIRITASSNPSPLINAFNNGASNLFIDSNSSVSAGSILFQLRNNALERFRVEGDGDTYNVNGTFGAISDASLKENIVDAGSQWQDIKNVRVRKYSLIADALSEANLIGAIAQELEQTSPGLVKTSDSGLKSIKYSVLYMKAIKALQEAMDRIEQLEAKVAAIETKGV